MGITKRQDGSPVSVPPGLEARELRVAGDDLVVFELPLGQQDPLVERRQLLTDAEKEVTSLVLEGFSNQAIAKKRGTANSTIAKQLEGIYRKLQVHSRAELALLFAVSPIDP